MSENFVKIVGLATGPVFGCPDLTWAAGQSLDLTRDGDTAELKNGNGNVIARAYFNGKKTQSYNVKIKGTVPATLERGTVLTVDGVAMILESYKTSKKSGDFQDMTLELAVYDEITVTQPAG